MPFVSAVRFYPALGKTAEYRQIAEERTRAMQSAGLDAQLSTATWGPDYSYLLLSYRHETLADYESSRAKVQVGFDEFNARQAPLARQSPVTFLNERLQATNPAGTVKWQQSNVLAPSVGKAADLRALLLEDGKRIEEMGRRFALLVQVAGPESGVFTRIFNYDSLAAFEEARAALPGNEAGLEFARKRDALLSRPVASTIREVLVPYPSR